MAGRSHAHTHPLASGSDGSDAWTPRGLVVVGVACLFAGAALAFGLYFARQALLLIYLSAQIAIGLAPLVRLLERRGLWRGGSMPRWAAVAAVYLAVGAAWLLGMMLVVPTLIAQAQDLARNAPGLMHDVQRWLIARGLLVRERTFGEVVRETPGATDAVGALLLTLWTLVGGIVGVVTIVVLSFYFLVETDALFGAFIRLFPRRRRIHVRAISHQITAKVSAWLSGQVMVAGIVGATAAIGLFLLGVPYFYVLAIIAAVGELIPLLGPVLAAVPAMAVACLISWKLALATAVFYLVQQQIENHVIVPRLMSSQVGLSSVAVIVAFLVGASVFGLVGAILAVPTAAIVQVLFFELVPAAEE
jgi:predicted PurR-regulated permease PerM